MMATSGPSTSVIPIFDLTKDDGKVIETPRMGSLPGSVADNAALSRSAPTRQGSRLNQDQTGLRCKPGGSSPQPVPPVSGAANTSSLHQPSSAVVQITPEQVGARITLADRISHNLWLQNYVELAREGRIHPVQPHPQLPSAENWASAITLRQVENGA